MSWTKDATSTETQDADPLSIIESIRKDGRAKLRAPIERIRRVYRATLEKTGNPKAAKKAVAALKKKLPGALLSGRFSSRDKPTRERLLSHSGLLCADLDELGQPLEDVRAVLLRSPHLWALFLSPSGDGLKAIFRVVANAEKHHASFLAVRAHVEELTGITIDESCKDVARLCFLSFDPNTYSNPNAAELVPVVETTLPPPGSGDSAGMMKMERRREIARELLGQITWQNDASGYCVCPGRHLHTNGDGTRDCEIHLDRVPTVHCFHNSCGGLVNGTNHELRSRIGKAESAKQESYSDTTALSEWPEPEPIRAELRPVLALRPEMIPEPFRAWIVDIAHRMQCPIDFVAAAAITMISSVVGAGCGIKPKRRDDWVVIPNLWGAAIGRPSMLKSPALAEAFKPMARLEARAKEEYDVALQSYVAEVEMYKAQKEALKSRMVKAAKGTETCSESDLKAAYMSLEPPEPPVWRRCKTNDTTIEKMSELLAKNPRGLLIFRDELIGLLTSWDKDGHESDRAFYLEGWNGNGSHTADRIGRGTIYTPNLCLSIFGGIQPSKLLNYLYKTVKNTENDGLIQRLQTAVFPDEPKEWQLVDQYPNHEEKNRAFSVVEKLAEMDFVALGAVLDQGEEIPHLHFSHEAQELFYEWLTGLETRLRRKDEDPIMVEHLGKFRSLLPSLALIFHLIEIADGTATGAVSLSSTEQAAHWCDYLESHARRIYGLVSNMTVQAAARLCRKLEEGALKDGFTVRDVYRKQWALLDDKEIVQAAIDELEAAGWLRQIASAAREPGRPGQPSLPRYQVNPKVKRPAPSISPERPTERTDRTAKTDSGGSVSESHEGVDDLSDAKPDDDDDDVMLL